MKNRLIIGIIILIIVLGGLYLSYLLACEDDWCYQYDWQRERRTDSYSSGLVPVLDSNEQTENPQESICSKVFNFEF